MKFDRLLRAYTWFTKSQMLYPLCIWDPINNLWNGPPGARDMRPNWRIEHREPVLLIASAPPGLWRLDVGRLEYSPIR